MRELQIPPRCEGCPQLSEPIEHFYSHAGELRAVSAMSPEEIKRRRGLIIEALSSVGLSAQEISDNIPSINDTRIALLEQEINATRCMEDVQQDIEEHTDGCPGKLTLRAAGSDGVTYEATLCRSHENYVDGEQDIEPVAVRRYPS